VALQRQLSTGIDPGLPGPTTQSFGFFRSEQTVCGLVFAIAKTLEKFLTILASVLRWQP
jgi:hypothetical protein